MKERRFLRELNSKNNEKGDLTYAVVMKLIRTSDNKPVANNLFNRLISKLFRSKSYEQIISDNFETILSKTNSAYRVTVLKMIMNDTSLEPIIKNKFAYIIREMNQDSQYKIREFLLDFKENEIANITFIEDNIDEILSNINPNYLFEAVKSMKGISENVDNKLNKALEDNKRAVVMYLLDSSTQYKSTKVDVEKREEMIEKYSDTLAIMIDELLKSEDKRMLDIIEIGGGAYSNVYEIGNKILKIGGVRRTHNIHNHKRILQPLARTNLIDEVDERPFACVEIADKVDVSSNYYEVNEEVLYEIWRDLRKDGIIWTDIKPNNVGKLKKVNVPTLNKKEMYVAPNSVGFDKELEEDPLVCGQWVIIDTDFIYSDEDKDIEWTEEAEVFERRYQQEQQEKVAEKYRNAEDIKEMKDEDKGLLF